MTSTTIKPGDHITRRGDEDIDPNPTWRVDEITCGGSIVWATHIYHGVRAPLVISEVLPA